MKSSHKSEATLQGFRNEKCFPGRGIYAQITSQKAMKQTNVGNAIQRHQEEASAALPEESIGEGPTSGEVGVWDNVVRLGVVIVVVVLCAIILWLAKR